MISKKIIQIALCMGMSSCVMATPSQIALTRAIRTARGLALAVAPTTIASTALVYLLWREWKSLSNEERHTLASEQGIKTFTDYAKSLQQALLNDYQAFFKAHPLVSIALGFCGLAATCDLTRGILRLLPGPPIRTPWQKTGSPTQDLANALRDHRSSLSTADLVTLSNPIIDDHLQSIETKAAILSTHDNTQAPALSTAIDCIKNDQATTLSQKKAAFKTLFSTPIVNDCKAKHQELEKLIDKLGSSSDFLPALVNDILGLSLGDQMAVIAFYEDDKAHAKIYRDAYTKIMREHEDHQKRLRALKNIIRFCKITSLIEASYDWINEKEDEASNQPPNFPNPPEQDNCTIN